MIIIRERHESMQRIRHRNLNPFTRGARRRELLKLALLFVRRLEESTAVYYPEFQLYYILYRMTLRIGLLR